MTLPWAVRFAAIRPSAVIRCANTTDVAAAIAHARDRGQPIAVRSGGHSFSGASTTDGVVIDVTPTSGVALSQGRAVIGAGTRLGAVYDALSGRGRTIPAGCGPTVGVSGLTLGGGLGILGRTYGTTADALRGATVVLADGRAVECSADHEPDLFWAIRGGGVPAAPGVVTTLVFETVPAPESTAFHLTFPPELLPTAVAVWQRDAIDAPDAVAASLVVAVAHGRPPMVVVFGAVVGPASFGAAQVDGLVAAIGRPLTDVRRHGSHRATKHWLSTVDNHGGPEADGAAMYIRSEFIRRSLSPDAIAGLVDRLAHGLVPGELRELDFNPWGGAYNRVPVDATAFPHRAERFLLKHSVFGPRTDWLDASYEITHPFGDGGAYPNFPEPGLPVEAYYGANTARLRAIKRTYDPDGVFGPV